MSDYGNFGNEFNASAVIAAYEKGRPKYLPTTISIILEELRTLGTIGDTDLISVVDAGTGTGLLTASILEANEPCISSIYAFDRLKMAETARRNPKLQTALKTRMLSVADASFGNTGIPDNTIDLYLSAQALHWGTRNLDNYQETIEETLRILRDQGSVFAIYNTPLANDESSFTAHLNKLLALKCSDAYYQAMTSGNIGVFLQDARSNLGSFFFDIAQRCGGRIVIRELNNPTTYFDFETICAYVFSNAFVNNAIKHAHDNQKNLRPELESDLKRLYQQFKDKKGHVSYGNTTWIIGAVGLRRK